MGGEGRTEKRDRSQISVNRMNPGEPFGWVKDP